MRQTYPLIIALFILTVIRAFADCPASYSPAMARTALEASNSSPLPDETCLCTLIKKATNREQKALITAYTRKKAISDTVLLCAFSHPKLRNDTKIRTQLITSWKKAHPSLSTVLNNYRQQGATGRADSLLGILNTIGVLGPYQLLQWIEIKEVLDDVASIPDLFHRVLLLRPRLQPLLLSRFSQLIDKTDRPTTDLLLRRFTTLIAANPRADSTDLRRWIVDQYGRKGLFERQLAVVLSAFTGAEKSLRCEQLRRITRTCLDNREYLHAIAAGRELVRHPCDTASEQWGAVVLFSAFRALNQPDSAAVWLQKSGKAALIRSAEACDFYLSSGRFAEASEHIGQLPPSLERDTLYLRYLLLTDSLERARFVAYEESNTLSRDRYSRLIWRFRIQLFRGATDTCGALLDTLVKVAPATEISRLQEYRYWLLRYADTPVRLAKFIQNDYTMYKGNRKKAAEQFCSAVTDSAAEWRIGLRIARQQIDHAEYDGAIATLQCAPAEEQPEYCYYLAEALLRKGEFDRARKLLQRVILDFPADQYTTRARLLLAPMPKEPK